MKNTFLLLTLGLFIFSSCNNHYVPNNLNKVTGQTKLSKKLTIDEDGVCWQDCLMPSIYKDEVTTYHVFTGDASIENVDLEELQIEIKAASTKWEKRKKPDCESTDPNDCFMACLVQVPAEYETFTVLKDIAQSDNYEVKTITKEILVKQGGYIEKQKVICDENVSADLVMDLQKTLEAQKYNTGPATQKFNPFLKSGLYKYQKDNNLPVGLLNLQTLDKLGVDYSK
jgi:Putative peptidoglycan binding domain.